jgi:hypothetical protein
VIFGHDGQCLFILIARDEKPGTLWQKPNEYDLDQARDKLEKTRKSPAQVAVELEGTKRGPCRNSGTEVPKSVIDGSEFAPLLGVA